MAIRNVKDMILKAAAKEFLDVGFSGTRMQAIADKAGINKALLHYHYNSKEALYHNVLRSQFESLIHALLELFESDEEFEPWLRRVISKLVSENTHRPHISRFLIWELSGAAKHLPQIFKEILSERSEGLIIQRTKAKLAKAGLGDYPPDQFMLNLLSLCIYPGMARPLLEQVLGKEVYSSKDFASQREEEIFMLIKYGIILRKRGA